MKKNKLYYKAGTRIILYFLFNTYFTLVVPTELVKEIFLVKEILYFIAILFNTIQLK